MIINSRHDKSMPMNSEVLFDVSRIIKPKKLVVPYYTLGVENVAWVEGFSEGLGSQSKILGDYFYLLAEDATAVARRSYTTDNLINITNIKTLYIDWENTGANLSTSFSRFVTTTSKGSNSNVFTARLSVSQSFVRKVDVLDVSMLSGEHFIQTHVVDGQPSSASKTEIRTYRVWGEG